MRLGWRREVCRLPAGRGSPSRHRVGRLRSRSNDTILFITGEKNQTAVEQRVTSSVSVAGSNRHESPRTNRPNCRSSSNVEHVYMRGSSGVLVSDGKLHSRVAGGRASASPRNSIGSRLGARWRSTTSHPIIADQPPNSRKNLHAEAMCHQGLPFQPLGSLALLERCVVAPFHTAASVHEVVGVRVDALGNLRQLLENRMAANSAEPVLRVAKIAFAPMHDPMPKATFGRLDVLADRVASVQLAREQP